MGIVSSVFSKDIVIDDTAFETAAKDFEALGDRISALSVRIDDLLTALKAGFNTPAGATFIRSCENNLRQPIEDQKVVITHISETLRDVKQMYQSVFDEYRELNNMMQQHQQS